MSGPPGSGKTTLAHAIARAVPCPAICRDEIKEGLFHARGGGSPALGDELSKPTFGIFFDVLRALLAGGVTLVAEAAFQDKLWRPELERLAELADIRVVHCEVDPEIAQQRIAERSGSRHRAPHADKQFLEALASGAASLASFVPVAIDAPSLRVDTTDTYDPPLEEIVDFVRRR